MCAIECGMALARTLSRTLCLSLLQLVLQIKDVEHDVCGVEKVKTSKTNNERPSTEAEEDWPLDQGGDIGVFISSCSSMRTLRNAAKKIKLTLSCIHLSHLLARHRLLACSLARSIDQSIVASALALSLSQK
jgi:hypothetical protein